MTEAQFQAAVIELAELCGWRLLHVADVRGRLRSHTSVGFPDLMMVRRRPRSTMLPDYPQAARYDMLAPELKVGRRTTTAEQLDWLHDLDGVAGCTAVVWRPDPAPPAERWWRVETAEGPDFGAIGRRLRGQNVV